MICFGKMPLKGGFGAFEIFCCLSRIGILLTTIAIVARLATKWRYWSDVLIGNLYSTRNIGVSQHVSEIVSSHFGETHYLRR